MRISELVKELLEVKENYGDMKVRYHDGVDVDEIFLDGTERDEDVVLLM